MPHAKPKRYINPMVLLDYRCYAPGGKIGTDYPPELTQVPGFMWQHQCHLSYSPCATSMNPHPPCSAFANCHC